MLWWWRRRSRSVAYYCSPVSSAPKPPSATNSVTLGQCDKAVDCYYCYCSFCCCGVHSMDGWWVISVVVGIFIYFASHRNVTTASSFVRSFIFPLTFVGSFIFIFAYRVFELCSATLCALLVRRQQQRQRPTVVCLLVFSSFVVCSVVIVVILLLFSFHVTLLSYNLSCNSPSNASQCRGFENRGSLYVCALCSLFQREYRPTESNLSSVRWSPVFCCSPNVVVWRCRWRRGVCAFVNQNGYHLFKSTLSTATTTMREIECVSRKKGGYGRWGVQRQPQCLYVMVAIGPIINNGFHSIA